jgi:hypothetical protein
MTVPSPDLDLVRAALGRHPHLRFHRVDLVKGAIVVFQADGGLAPDAHVRDVQGRGGTEPANEESTPSTGGLNGKITLITRRVYGFHSASALIGFIVLYCSGLVLHPLFKSPNLLP